MPPAHQLEWRLVAGTREHRRRVAHARGIVAGALDRGPAWIAVSGGKDSVALLHLVRSLAPDTPAWFIDSGAETPDTVAVLDRLRAEFAVQTVDPALSIDAMAELVGAWGYTGAKRLAGAHHWRAGDWKEILIREPARRLAETFGYRVLFTGLRADESRGRAMRMRTYGPVHTDADGIAHACPLAWWSGRDSLAYAYTHGLPISALYQSAGHPPPQDRRTGTMLGATGLDQGRIVALRRRYPGAFAALTERFPALRAHQ